MQAHESDPGRLRQTINDLVMAEMFLLQATVESVSVLGEGAAQIGRELSARNEQTDPTWQTLAGVLQRTASDAIEPYTSRLKYLRS